MNQNSDTCPENNSLDFRVSVVTGLYDLGATEEDVPRMLGDVEGRVRGQRGLRDRNTFA